MAPRYPWRPLKRATPVPPSDALVADLVRHTGETRDKILEGLADDEARTTIWKNDLYQVAVRELDGDYEGYVHLNIRRCDGGPILRDWRHFQRIKNEVVGPECEAVEIYPAESRLVDTSNKFHLFACKDPTFRLPFGDLFGDKRDVSYVDGQVRGTRQRPE